MKLKTILSIVVLLGMHMKAHAALTLTINTVTETFSISGSDTGTPDTAFTGGVIRWSLTGIGTGGVFDNVFYDDDVSFSTDVGNPGNDGLGHDTDLSYDTNVGGRLRLQLGMSSDGNQTITGLGAAKSYAGFSVATKTIIGNIANGTNFPEETTATFGDATIAVVPEPHVYYVISSTAMIAFFMVRRCFQSKNASMQIA